MTPMRDQQERVVAGRRCLFSGLQMTLVEAELDKDAPERS
jgi:hypothetical protein